MTTETVKTNDQAPKTIRGPKAAVAGFIRPRDKQRIWVFTRKGESIESAISRVMQRNGASGQPYEKCS